MAASIPVDLELRKAFQELQTKMISTTQQLKVNDMQIESLKRQNQHGSLVLSELNAQPSNVNTYQGVGRMFVLKPKSEIISLIETKQKNNAEKAKIIETQKNYLQNSMKEAENSLRELVVNKQKK